MPTEALSATAMTTAATPAWQFFDTRVARVTRLSPTFIRAPLREPEGDEPLWEVPEQVASRGRRRHGLLARRRLTGAGPRERAGP